MDLTNEQWAILEPLIPKPVPRADGKGRPRRNDREILNGILWVLKTGARWQDLPQRYPPYQTCHRRWKIERLFAWLGNFRHLVMRFDYYITNYLGFVHLGCTLILLRCYF